LGLAGFTGIGYGLHNEIVAPYLLHYGTEAQKQTYLPKLATGTSPVPRSRRDHSSGIQADEAGQGAVAVLRCFPPSCALRAHD